jgi:hypothetical protein
MEKNFRKELFNLIKQGRFTANHGKGGGKWNFCSLAIPSFNVIIKGQYWNEDISKNVVLSFFGANTDELLGKRFGLLRVFVEVVSSRPIFTSF